MSAEGGETRWLDVPGDPREQLPRVHRVARAARAAIVVQQLNRLQQTARVLLARRGEGQDAAVLTEHDDAWVDQQEEIHWINKGRGFLWLSERDGWRHVYRGGARR